MFACGRNPYFHEFQPFKLFSVGGGGVLEGPVNNISVFASSEVVVSDKVPSWHSSCRAADASEP